MKALPYAGITRIRYKGLPTQQWAGSQPKLPQRIYLLSNDLICLEVNMLYIGNLAISVMFCQLFSWLIMAAIAGFGPIIH